MSCEKERVRRFYEHVWNRRDKGLIPDLLDASLEFRGSLGHEARGHAGFSEYLDRVHAALEAYRCEILELVAEPGRAFARMRFSGVHVGEFLGYPASHRRLEWEGAALFHFRGHRISRIWVLGDLASLRDQLSGDPV